MQNILMNVNWMVVVISTAVSFALGAAWYSKSMFGDKWMKGSGTPHVSGRPMSKLLTMQAVATFIYMWALMVASTHSTALLILVAVATAGMVKLNGLFAGKSYYAVSVEAGYILAQGAVMLIVLRIL